MAEQVAEAFQKTIDNVCKLVKTSAHITKNADIKFVAKYCEAGSRNINTLNLLIKYREDPDGTKRFVAELASGIVEEFVYDAEMDIALDAAMISFLSNSIPETPLGGAAVGLTVLGVGYYAAKTSSEKAGELTAALVYDAFDKFEEMIAEDSDSEILEKKDNKITLTTDIKIQKNILPGILESNIENLQVSIGSETYDVKAQENNLLTRNAVDKIPEVSFLLSQIDIYPGDILDVGDKGLYTVKQDECMSEIAEKYGMTTQKLVELNTWLIDDGKVHFDQNKVLVSVDASDLTNKVHTLVGTDAKDRLIDHNGGNDTLKGGGGNDYLEGGEGNDELYGGGGYDTYIADNGDTIKDSDGKGSVSFAGIEKLTGGKQHEEGSSTYDGNNGETYNWSNGTLTVTNEGKTLTIENFSNHNLDIYLEPKKKPDPPAPEAPPRSAYDPLVLDLGGNGIITTGEDAGIHFDLNSDGFKELTGFVNAEDGLLVLDRNDDGQISDGTELFGDSTRLLNGKIAQNGFAALSELDDDKDGVIDKNDAAFDKLRIFQDFNQNGKVDEGELFSLEEKKIAAINLNYQNSTYVDKYGNAHQQLGTYEVESGETRTLTDVAFATNQTLTETDMLPETPEIAALPDAKGYGKVYDLHQAMLRDTSGRLQHLVEMFVSCSDRDTRQALTKHIVYTWAGQDSIITTEANRKIKTLDTFFGSGVGNVWLNCIYRFDQLQDAVYYQLMRDSRLQSLFNDITYTLDSKSGTYVGRYDNVVPVLASMIEQSPETSQDLVQDFIHSVRGINPYNSLNLDAMRGEVNTWLANHEDVFSDETLGIMGSLAVGASDKSDTITGNDQDEILYSFDGNDTIKGKSGNDILIGGQGNDMLEGGSGDDIYRFSRGFGKDRINNLDTTAGRYDVIEFTGDIYLEELSFSRSGDDLIIDIGTTGDQIRVESHFYQDSTGGYAVDAIRFVDGTTMDIGSSCFQVMNTLANPITDKGDEIHGTLDDDVIDGLGGNDTIFGHGGSDMLKGSAGNDTIYGDDGADILYGDDGNDRLYGGSGDDQLYGGIGADVLTGGGGRNLLVGGKGDDWLEGGNGSDTFQYGMGDGRDTVKTGHNIDSVQDILDLSNGIKMEDVSARREVNDLLLNISDGGRIRVENYFLNSTAPIKEILFADGVWNATQVEAFVRTGTAGNDYLYGTNDQDILHGLEGSDTIYGYNGDDQLYGDEDNDYVYGGSGNDTLEGGSGNDHLVGDGGNDILVGGAGSDTLTGGTGNDIYRYDAGFGHDLIYNTDGGTDRMDVVEFGAGIDPTQIIAVRSGNNLTLNVSGGGDSITVSNYFSEIDSGGTSFINEIRFVDGTIWSVEDIKQLTTIITDGDDEIHGYSDDDVLDGSSPKAFSPHRAVFLLAA